MRVIECRTIHPTNVFPFRVLFDNGNERIVRNIKDRELLRVLLDKVNSNENK